MKLLYSFVILLFIVGESSSQVIPVPLSYAIIDSVFGDLDKDGVDELVVAYNTKNEDAEISEGVPRELIIYKKKNEKWIVWQKSHQALYGSRDGGMMGDPFGDILIDKGVLNISQSGGSSWKWSQTDKYLYDGKVFKLIGYENNYGKPCEYWEGVDFNLVTGKLIVEKEFETCEKGDQEVRNKQNEIFFKKNIVITLQNRSDKEIKIISPKNRYEIYIAIKRE